MAKVEARLGFTLKIGKGNQYEFAKAEMVISDIDTEQDIDSQLSVADNAIRKTWEKVTDLAGEEILTQIGELEQGLQLQLKKKFREIDVEIQALKDIAVKKSL